MKYINFIIPREKGYLIDLAKFNFPDAKRVFDDAWRETWQATNPMGDDNDVQHLKPAQQLFLQMLEADRGSYSFSN